MIFRRTHRLFTTRRILAIIPIGVLFLAACSDKNDHHAPVNYNVYYGSLHNHSALAGGTGTQLDAYQYARETAKLDFFSLAEHDYGFDNVTWSAAKNAANESNADGAFVAFWGFEWSSDAYGHVSVINSDDYCISDPSSATGTFTELCSWLNTQNCVAFFNHPGVRNNSGTEFNHFSGPVTDKIAGMELWNKNDPFSVFYYNDGYYPNDNNKSYFDEALNRGWKIGASGSHDDHNGTWGTSNDYRLAILASNLTRASIFAALQERRFYSTLDKNLKLSFTIDGNEMGSDVTAGKRGFRIITSDGDNELFVEVVLLNKDHTIVQLWTPDSTHVDISDTLDIQQDNYYYVKVTQQDGDEAISSPIWSR
jgi:hypothetical protein